MDQERIELVQTSLAQVLPQARETAEAFYGRLFELNPDVRPLFTGDMEVQGNKFMSTLGHIVQGLDRLDVITPSLERMGREHVGYGVKPEHYDRVLDSLLWALQQRLGDDFTSEARTAWGEAFDVISGIMRAAASEMESET